MKYHLWDTEAGSYIGQYTDEGAALATVKSLVDRYGESFADELSLGREREDGTVLPPLTDGELVALLASGRHQQPDDERDGRVIGAGQRLVTGSATVARSLKTTGRDGE